uniref:Uncharacterized protein n=1 Tax=Zea mays TaxID=4577 RepID=C4J710_MAIZE|nr:unknown [Zea mays]
MRRPSKPASVVSARRSAPRFQMR